MVLGILVTLGVSGIFLGASRNRLLPTVAASTVILLTVWLASVVAYYSDWRDSDEFLVCTPTCTRSQDVIGTFMVGLPIVLMGWLVAAAVIGWRRRARTE